MALAFLCQEVVKADSKIMAPLFEIPDYPRTTTSVAAFIVDHQMRKGSDKEAKQVAAELSRLGIEPHVLQMDWSSHGDPSQLSNVETVARMLRYPAIARACRDRGINSILLAHHADDQHESVLTRSYSDYLGAGLAGMGTVVNVPECAGIYGVDNSGAPLHGRRQQGSNEKPRNARPMAIESGGMKVGRPLLSVTKEDLVTVCKENEIKWFEDSTNKDPTLTIRNTLRHVIKQDELPLALSRRRILQLATKISSENDDIDAAALKYLKEMPLVLNLRSGTATFTIPKSLMDPSEEDYKVSASVLRKMLEIVSPKIKISLQNLDEAADIVFNSRQDNKTPARIQIAGVTIETITSGAEGSSSRTLILSRANPDYSDRAKFLKLPIPKGSGTSRWSEWRLFDGRYWLRVHPPERVPHSGQEVTVKFLSASDIADLRKADTVARTQSFERRLKAAKGDSRFTVPAIMLRDRKDPFAVPEATDKLVALPSLGWCVKGWQRNRNDSSADCWRYDIRYKHVNVDLGGKHEILPDEIRIAHSKHRQGNHQHS